MFSSDAVGSSKDGATKQVVPSEFIRVLREDVQVKHVRIEFANGVSVSSIWDYVVKREYGDVTSADHTNVPQAAVWLLRSLKNKGEAYDRWTGETTTGNFQSKSIALGATAIAPTNVTMGRARFMFSLSEKSVAGRRFAMLMSLFEELSNESYTLESFDDLRAFRMSEFFSRLQLATVLTTPEPISGPSAYDAFWLNGGNKYFAPKYNNMWIPLRVTLTGFNRSGFWPYHETFTM